MDRLWTHFFPHQKRACEQDNQNWAKKLIELLEEINRVVNGAGGKLESSESQKYCQKYREILHEAEKECPRQMKQQEKANGGRLKRTKSRNLLERLQKIRRRCFEIYG